MKKFLLSILTLVFLYLLGLTKFPIKMYQNIFEFQNQFFLFDLILRGHLPPPVLFACNYLWLQIFGMLCLRETFLLMVQNSGGNMWARLVNIDGIASITCNFIYHMQFPFLNDEFSVLKQVLIFLVVKMT